ncbi:MAG: orotidine-5'-phosphate decarboxylase [Pseudobdellovibrionaceae bacterium]
MTSQPLRNPLCLPLDVDHEEKALKLVEQLGGVVGGFKLGPRLIYQGGRELVQKIAKVAPVFVDCKFFDIPSTMEAAVRTSFEAGASLVTVHAMAGEEALRLMADLEAELSKKRPFRILAVTILTSWKESSMPSIFRQQPIREHVRELAELVKRSGLRSVVCSAEEIEILKDLDLYLVTPGIRFPHEEKGDQKRVMGPQEAISLGSSVLVVGRPIFESQDPLKKAQEYLKAIESAH